MSPSKADVARRVLGTLLSRQEDSTTKDYKTIKKLIQKYPDVTSQKIFQSFGYDSEVPDFPLFALATKRIGSTWVEHMDLLELVYDSFPDAIGATSSYGMLPLQNVCHKSLHPRIILYFLKKYPQAAIQKDEQGGWTPLAYYLLGSTAPHKAVIKTLVKAAPSTIECEYERGQNLDEANGSLQPEMPHPLAIAIAKDYELSILEMLIPTKPKSACLKIEVEPRFERMNGVVTPEKAELLARRVSGYIQILQLDTMWFTREGLISFLTELANSNPSSLGIFDIHIASNVFGDSKVRRALSKLLVQSPNLDGIRVRKPSDGMGPANDDKFFSALAEGVEGRNAPITDLGIDRARGRSFSGLDRILCSVEAVGILRTNFKQAGIQSLVRGIRESQTLKGVMLLICEMPTGGMNQVVQALANSPTVIKVRLELNQAEQLPSLSQLTNLSVLDVETSGDERLYEHGPTNALLELLDTSTNLVHLEVTHLHLPATRISEVLKRNTTLKCLKIHDCLDTNEISEAIVAALRDSNAALLSVEVNGENGPHSMDGYWREQLTYYTTLNAVGRDQVMQVEEANMSDLFQILVNLSEMHYHSEHVSTALLYGIMRESPSLWSSEYNNEVEDNENDLVDAVKGLSLQDE